LLIWSWRIKPHALFKIKMILKWVCTIPLGLEQTRLICNKYLIPAKSLQLRFILQRVFLVLLYIDLIYYAGVYVKVPSYLPERLWIFFAFQLVSGV
jgi:hypothetical protein